MIQAQAWKVECRGLFVYSCSSLCSGITPLLPIDHRLQLVHLSRFADHLGEIAAFLLDEIGGAVEFEKLAASENHDFVVRDNGLQSVEVLVSVKRP